MDEVRKRRDKSPQNGDIVNLSANQEDETISETPTKNLKYYFNRFRYYHYCLAEKLDTIIGVVCLTIIKIYFSLMGYEQSALEDIEAPD
ncbi:PREDICTED: uncharacterized protein LOC107188789 [Dufourea novaeangliae]|uniref:uncharacterized protein LOC107188789 n=1 Tax=Dufourea novaeangliae TaxID=178035 RepID=UPI000766ED46|nr:PREDICTED: uncharacterized protein LOC107188789 [Dufourea novaeangliae]